MSLSPLFERAVFDETLTRVARHFEKSAPPVADWCDKLAAARDKDITIAHLKLLWYLHTEDVSPQSAISIVCLHGF